MHFEDLMRECSAHLSASDFEELDAVCSTPPSGKSTFAKAWTVALDQWHSQNRRERSQRMTQDSAAVLPAENVDSDQLRGDQQAAWQATDPLLRETGLQRSLWNWIETRRRQAPYSLDDLIGYALQLQLLERRETWNESDGQNQFQEHTQSFLEPVLEELRKQELSA